MDDMTFYQQVLDFVSQHLSHVCATEPERILSSALASAGLVISSIVIASSLLWLTTKSVLLRHTPILYWFAITLLLCGLGHLGDLFHFPLSVQLTIDFLSATVSLLAAVVTYRQRHVILSAVFKFKYAIGLMRSLEKFDEVDRHTS